MICPKCGQRVKNKTNRMWVKFKKHGGQLKRVLIHKKCGEKISN